MGLGKPAEVCKDCGAEFDKPDQRKGDRTKPLEMPHYTTRMHTIENHCPDCGSQSIRHQGPKSWLAAGQFIRLDGVPLLDTNEGEELYRVKERAVVDRGLRDGQQVTLLASELKSTVTGETPPYHHPKHDR